MEANVCKDRKDNGNMYIYDITRVCWGFHGDGKMLGGLYKDGYKKEIIEVWPIINL